MTSLMTAFYAGRTAALAKQIVTVNPYKAGTEEYAMWWAAWHETFTGPAGVLT